MPEDTPVTTTTVGFDMVASFERMNDGRGQLRASSVAASVESGSDAGSGSP